MFSPAECDSERAPSTATPAGLWCAPKRIVFIFSSLGCIARKRGPASTSVEAFPQTRRGAPKRTVFTFLGNDRVIETPQLDERHGAPCILHYELIYASKRRHFHV